MSKFNPRRREFLQWSATGIASVAFAGLLEGCVGTDGSSSTDDDLTAGGTLRQRKSWHKLTTVEKDLYRVAVDLLNKEKITGKEYTTQFQRLAWVHQNSCPHSNWFFLPWHRVYLAFYESELVRVLTNNPATADAAATFALPYWDWTVNPAVPTEFFNTELDPKVLHKATRQLALARVVTTLDNSATGSVGQPVVDRLMATVNFYAFGSFPSKGTNGMQDGRTSGIIEATPHNYVHRTLAGNMASFLSPLDPIFWLHHCNVDRLWNMWMTKRAELKQDPLPYDPKATTSLVGPTVPKPSDLIVAGIAGDYREYWKNFAIVLQADQRGTDVVHTGNKPNDVLDSKQFKIAKSEFAKGVVYDTDPVQPPPFSASAVRLTQSITRVDFIEERKAVSDTTFTAKIKIAEAQAVIDAFKASNGQGTMTLVIENIPIPTDEAVRNSVHVAMRVAEADLKPGAIPRVRELGDISFFSHGVSGAHAAHSKNLLSVSLDVTEFFKTATPSTASVWVSGQFKIDKGVPEPVGWAAWKAALPALLKASIDGLNVVLIASV